MALWRSGMTRLPSLAASPTWCPARAAIWCAIAASSRRMQSSAARSSRRHLPLSGLVPAIPAPAVQKPTSRGRYLSAARWTSPSTTPDTASASPRVRIVHPFHPQRGQEFVLVAERSSRHGDRVWYERADCSVATIPRAWTDLAAPDPFVVLAEGRAHFRLDDLAELAELVAGIRGAEQASNEADDV